MSYTHREVELLQWFAKRAEVGRILGMLEAERHRVERNISKMDIIVEADKLRAQATEVKHIIIMLKEEKDKIKEIILRFQKSVGETK